MKTKPPLIGGLLFLFAFSSSGLSQEKESEQLDTLIAEHEKALKEFSTKLRAAKPDERKDIYKQQPIATTAVEAAQTFIKTFPEHTDVPRRASWILMQRSKAADTGEIFDALTAHHLSSPDLGEAITAVLYDSSDAGEKFAETVLEKTENAQMKGLAAYVLSSKLRRATDEESKAKRLVYLKTVVENIGDYEFRGRKIKTSAEGALFAAENLEIGKMAPDIEGEDTEGVG